MRANAWWCLCVPTHFLTAYLQDNILLRHGLWPLGDAGPEGDTTWCGDDDTLAVVMDFGECLDCVDGGGVGSFRSGDPCAGAPLYVPPEHDRALAGRAREFDYGGYDAWTLGLMLHRMLGGPRGEGLMPFPGAAPRPVTDAEYAPPVDVSTAGLRGVMREYATAAGIIVRGLLRVDPAERCTLRGAVGRLEALLFLVLPPPGAAAVRGDGEAEAFSRAAALRAAAAAADPRAHMTVRALLAVDYGGSPRCSEDAAMAAYLDLMG